MWVTLGRKRIIFVNTKSCTGEGKIYAPLLEQLCYLVAPPVLFYAKVYKIKISRLLHNWDLNKAFNAPERTKIYILCLTIICTRVLTERLFSGMFIVLYAGKLVKTLLSSNDDKSCKVSDKFK